MTNIRSQLSVYFANAFTQLGLNRTYGEVVISDRPDLAPFQCNGALPAAKLLKQSPREIANKIVQLLSKVEDISRIEIADPGFLNITPAKQLYSKQLEAILFDQRAGIPIKKQPNCVIIDFGGPNVAKPMHVGHLRSSINGDCLQRLFRFLGDHVISDIHLGDWGLQMGQLLSFFQKKYPEWVYFDPHYKGEYPKESPVSLEDLQYSYPLASLACKTDPDEMEKARKAIYELQKGRPGYRALWQHFYTVSVNALQHDFELLDIRFDLWKGESDIAPIIDDMIEDFKQKKIAHYDQGALIVPFDQNQLADHESEKAQSESKKEIELSSDSIDTNKKRNPPLMLLKSDGSVLYETTDLATILDRRHAYNPDFILYVVDLRQELHFKKVFKVAKLIGYMEKMQLEFIGLGTMNGADGRPYKTREGGVLRLKELIDMTVKKAKERLDDAGISQDITDQEKQEIAKKIGISALKFADLSNNRTTSYIFDLERFTSFEGKTGPYLLYAVVRIKSLLDKADFQIDSFTFDLSQKKMNISDCFLIKEEQEKQLVYMLDRFYDVLIQAYQKRMPNLICDYAYLLSQSFSSFYAACTILAGNISAPVKQTRLVLSYLTLKQLRICLELLGIEIVERM